MKILIVTGGRIDPVFARDFLNSRIFDHVIVVDGALDFWDKVGATTNNKERFDHLVGDFDTISPVILDKYRGRVGLEVHAFIPEKDNTDTDIAVRLACTLAADEASEISLLGALGSRADHSLANLQLLKLIRDAGHEGIIIDRGSRIRLIGGQVMVKRDSQFGDFISLIPVTRTLEHVTLKGFKYPLESAHVDWGESLCVSNEITADEALISIGEGLAFLIESRDIQEEV